MTRPWKNEPLWPGATVAVLGSGPSMSQSVADALREYKTIAVNDTIRVAPWADVLFALDAGSTWPAYYFDFAGLRLTAVEEDAVDAYYIGPRWELVRMSPSREIEVHNSGLSAIRFAAQMGAKRVLLAGFDHPSRIGHFYDDVVHRYEGVAEGIVQITSELASKGVTVERFELPQPTPPKRPKA